MGTSTVVESRLDICKLATIHKYFLSRDLNINNRSLLIRTIIEVYEGIITSSPSTDIKPFESNSEAFLYLSKHGITFKQGSKGHRDIIKALQDESLMEFEHSTITVDGEKVEDAMDMLRGDKDE